MTTAHVLPTTHTDPGPPLAWADVVDRVAGADVYWLSCAGDDGAPHTRPVLGVWAQEAFHCCVGPHSVKGRVLARDPRCSVALQAAGLDVVLAGRVARVREDTALRRVAASYADKYGWQVEVRAGAFWAEGAPTAGPPPFHVLRVHLGTVHAFPTGGELTGQATRWRSPVTGPRPDG